MSRTLRHELTNFLHPRLGPDAMMEFSKWLADRPTVAAWLDVPESRRHVILEAEAASTARARLNAVPGMR